MNVAHFEVNGLASTLHAERLEAMLHIPRSRDGLPVADAVESRVARWQAPVIRWYQRGWLA